MGHGATCRCLCCPTPECVSGSPSADGVPMACAWRRRLEPVVAPSVSSGARIRPSQWWYTETTGKSRCYLTAISRSGMLPLAVDAEDHLAGCAGGASCSEGCCYVGQDEDRRDRRAQPLVADQL